MTSHPVGLSGNLAPRQVMRATINQFDIAVWRSESGIISAWDNRCPHRGMRLSHGFVRGESLACAYHGWHYNCEGFCHYIPAHPELTPPKTVRPVIYSVIERHGLIWINPTAEARAHELPDNLIPLRTLTFECDENTALHAMSSTAQHAGESFEPGDTLSESPRIITVNTPAIANGIIIAFHQCAPHNVIAHVLVQNTLSSAAQIDVSRWLESVRRHAEANVSEYL